MNEFLKKSKKASQTLSSFSKVHVVIGNEACDLDSTVSAIAHAYHLAQDSQSEEEAIIPVLNIPQDEVALRTEITHLLPRCNVQLTDLVYRDDIDLSSISNLTVTLVDHNVPAECDAGLDPHVVEVLDHHVNSRHDDEDRKISITREMVGSCATLVARHILDRHLEILDNQLVKLLLGTILLDTLNMSEAAGKATPTDEDVVQRLGKLSPRIKQQEVFNDVQAAKFNISGLTTAQMLRKDFKSTSSATCKIGFSSVTLPLQDVLDRADLETSLKNFCEHRFLDVNIIMTIDLEGSRQLAIYSEDPNLRDTLEERLQGSVLELERIDSSVTNLSAFDQHNGKASRKVVLPLVGEILRTLDSDSDHNEVEEEPGENGVPGNVEELSSNVNNANVMAEDGQENGKVMPNDWGKSTQDNLHDIDNGNDKIKSNDQVLVESYLEAGSRAANPFGGSDSTDLLGGNPFSLMEESKDEGGDNLIDPLSQSGNLYPAQSIDDDPFGLSLDPFSAGSTPLSPEADSNLNSSNPFQLMSDTFSSNDNLLIPTSDPNPSLSNPFVDDPTPSSSLLDLDPATQDNPKPSEMTVGSSAESTGDLLGSLLDPIPISSDLPSFVDSPTIGDSFSSQFEPGLSIDDPFGLSDTFNEQHDPSMTKSDPSLSFSDSLALVLDTTISADDDNSISISEPCLTTTESKDLNEHPEIVGTKNQIEDSDPFSLSQTNAKEPSNQFQVDNPYGMDPFDVPAPSDVDHTDVEGRAVEKSGSFEDNFGMVNVSKSSVVDPTGTDDSTPVEGHDVGVSSAWRQPSLDELKIGDDNVLPDNEPRSEDALDVEIESKPSDQVSVEDLVLEGKTDAGDTLGTVLPDGESMIQELNNGSDVSIENSVGTDPFGVSSTGILDDPGGFDDDFGMVSMSESSVVDPTVTVDNTQKQPSSDELEGGDDNVLPDNELFSEDALHVEIESKSSDQVSVEDLVLEGKNDAGDTLGTVLPDGESMIQELNNGNDVSMENPVGTDPFGVSSTGILDDPGGFDDDFGMVSMNESSVIDPTGTIDNTQRQPSSDELEGGDDNELYSEDALDVEIESKPAEQVSVEDLVLEGKTDTDDTLGTELPDGISMIQELNNGHNKNMENPVNTDPFSGSLNDNPAHSPNIHSGLDPFGMPEFTEQPGVVNEESLYSDTFRAVDYSEPPVVNGIQIQDNVDPFGMSSFDEVQSAPPLCDLSPQDDDPRRVSETKEIQLGEHVGSEGVPTESNVVSEVEEEQEINVVSQPKTPRNSLSESSVNDDEDRRFSQELNERELSARFSHLEEQLADADAEGDYEDDFEDDDENDDDDVFSDEDQNPEKVDERSGNERAIQDEECVESPFHGGENDMGDLIKSQGVSNAFASPSEVNDSIIEEEIVTEDCKLPIEIVEEAEELDFPPDDTVGVRSACSAEMQNDDERDIHHFNKEDKNYIADMLHSNMVDNAVDIHAINSGDKASDDEDAVQYTPVFSSPGHVYRPEVMERNPDPLVYIQAKETEHMFQKEKDDQNYVAEMIYRAEHGDPVSSFKLDTPPFFNTNTIGENYKENMDVDSTAATDVVLGDAVIEESCYPVVSADFEASPIHSENLDSHHHEADKVDTDNSMEDMNYVAEMLSDDMVHDERGDISVLNSIDGMTNKMNDPADLVTYEVSSDVHSSYPQNGNEEIELATSKETDDMVEEAHDDDDDDDDGMPDVVSSEERRVDLDVIDVEGDMGANTLANRLLFGDEISPVHSTEIQASVPNELNLSDFQANERREDTQNVVAEVLSNEMLCSEENDQATSFTNLSEDVAISLREDEFSRDQGNDRDLTEDEVSKFKKQDEDDHVAVMLADDITFEEGESMMSTPDLLISVKSDMKDDFFQNIGSAEHSSPQGSDDEESAIVGIVGNDVSEDQIFSESDEEESRDQFPGDGFIDIENDWSPDDIKVELSTEQYTVNDTLTVNRPCTTTGTPLSPLPEEAEIPEDISREILGSSTDDACIENEGRDSSDLLRRESEKAFNSRETYSEDDDWKEEEIPDHKRNFDSGETQGEVTALSETPDVLSMDAEAVDANTDICDSDVSDVAVLVSYETENGSGVGNGNDIMDAYEKVEKEIVLNVTNKTYDILGEEIEEDADEEKEPVSDEENKANSNTFYQSVDQNEENSLTLQVNDEVPDNDDDDAEAHLEQYPVGQEAVPDVQNEDNDLWDERSDCAGVEIENIISVQNTRETKAEVNLFDIDDRDEGSKVPNQSGEVLGNVVVDMISEDIVHETESIINDQNNPKTEAGVNLFDIDDKDEGSKLPNESGEVLGNVVVDMISEDIVHETESIVNDQNNPKTEAGVNLFDIDDRDEGSKLPNESGEVLGNVVVDMISEDIVHETESVINDQNNQKTEAGVNLFEIDDRDEGYEVPNEPQQEQGSIAVHVDTISEDIVHENKGYINGVMGDLEEDPQTIILGTKDPDENVHESPEREGSPKLHEHEIEHDVENEHLESLSNNEDESERVRDKLTQDSDNDEEQSEFFEKNKNLIDETMHASMESESFAEEVLKADNIPAVASIMHNTINDVEESTVPDTNANTKQLLSHESILGDDQENSWEDVENHQKNIASDTVEEEMVVAAVTDPVHAELNTDFHEIGEESTSGNEDGDNSVHDGDSKIFSYPTKWTDEDHDTMDSIFPDMMVRDVINEESSEEDLSDQDIEPEDTHLEDANVVSETVEKDIVEELDDQREDFILIKGLKDNEENIHVEEDLESQPSNYEEDVSLEEQVPRAALVDKVLVRMLAEDLSTNEYVPSEDEMNESESLSAVQKEEDIHIRAGNEVAFDVGSVDDDDEHGSEAHIQDEITMSSQEVNIRESSPSVSADAICDNNQITDDASRQDTSQDLGDGVMDNSSSYDVTVSLNDDILQPGSDAEDSTRANDFESETYGTQDYTMTDTSITDVSISEQETKSDGSSGQSYLVVEPHERFIISDIEETDEDNEDDLASRGHKLTDKKDADHVVENWFNTRSVSSDNSEGLTEEESRQKEAYEKWGQPAESNQTEKPDVDEDIPADLHVDVVIEETQMVPPACLDDIPEASGISSTQLESSTEREGFQDDFTSEEAFLQGKYFENSFGDDVSDADSNKTDQEGEEMAFDGLIVSEERKEEAQNAIEFTNGGNDPDDEVVRSLAKEYVDHVVMDAAISYRMSENQHEIEGHVYSSEEKIPEVTTSAIFEQGVGEYIDHVVDCEAEEAEPKITAEYIEGQQSESGEGVEVDNPEILVCRYTQPEETAMPFIMESGEDLEETEEANNFQYDNRDEAISDEEDNVVQEIVPVVENMPVTNTALAFVMESEQFASSDEEEEVESHEQEDNDDLHEMYSGESREAVEENEPMGATAAIDELIAPVSASEAQNNPTNFYKLSSDEGDFDDTYSDLLEESAKLESDIALLSTNVIPEVDIQVSPAPDAGIIEDEIGSEFLPHIEPSINVHTQDAAEEIASTEDVVVPLTQHEVQTMPSQDFEEEFQDHGSEDGTVNIEEVAREIVCDVIKKATADYIKADHDSASEEPSNGEVEGTMKPEEIVPRDVDDDVFEEEYDHFDDSSIAYQKKDDNTSAPQTPQDSKRMVSLEESLTTGSFSADSDDEGGRLSPGEGIKITRPTELPLLTASGQGLLTTPSKKSRLATSTPAGMSPGSILSGDTPVSLFTPDFESVTSTPGSLSDQEAEVLDTGVRLLPMSPFDKKSISVDESVTKNLEEEWDEKETILNAIRAKQEEAERRNLQLEDPPSMRQMSLDSVDPMRRGVSMDDEWQDDEYSRQALQGNKNGAKKSEEGQSDAFYKRPVPKDERESGDGAEHTLEGRLPSDGVILREKKLTRPNTLLNRLSVQSVNSVFSEGSIDLDNISDEDDAEAEKAHYHNSGSKDSSGARPKEKRKIRAELSLNLDDTAQHTDDGTTPAILTPTSTEMSWEDDTPMNKAEPIEEYTAREEHEDRWRWRKVNLGGKDYTIDMKAINPYKKVLSHGGYYGEGLNAIIVFASCYLPEKTKKDYTYVMNNLFLYVVSTLELLVAQEYIIIYFHGSASRAKVPSLGWMRKCYQMIDRKLRKSLKGLYLVHPTTWLKAIVQLTKPFISHKFSNKLKFVKSLAELKTLVSMEYVYIPEEVKRFDQNKNKGGGTIWGWIAGPPPVDDEDWFSLEEGYDSDYSITADFLLSPHNPPNWHRRRQRKRLLIKAGHFNFSSDEEAAKEADGEGRRPHRRNLRPHPQQQPQPPTSSSHHEDECSVSTPGSIGINLGPAISPQDYLTEWYFKRRSQSCSGYIEDDTFSYNHIIATPEVERRTWKDVFGDELDRQDYDAEDEDDCCDRNSATESHGQLELSS